MASPAQKQQKIEALIKVRQIQFDQENMRLNQIQQRRQEALKELQHFQNAYIKGIDKLNLERQSPERKMLEALERAVDFAKSQWYHKLKALRMLEHEEKLQMQEVFEAQRRLRMLEKLEERYSDQQFEIMKKVEQKQLDEFAIVSARRKTAE